MLIKMAPGHTSSRSPPCSRPRRPLRRARGTCSSWNCITVMIDTVRATDFD